MTIIKFRVTTPTAGPNKYNAEEPIRYETIIKCVSSAFKLDHFPSTSEIVELTENELLHEFTDDEFFLGAAAAAVMSGVHCIVRCPPEKIAQLFALADHLGVCAEFVDGFEGLGIEPTCLCKVAEVRLFPRKCRYRPGRE